MADRESTTGPTAESGTKRKRPWLRRVGVVVGCLLAGAIINVLVACGRPPTQTTTFVIPDGFRGLIAIAEDPNATAGPTPRDYRVIVPASGIVRLRTLAELPQTSKHIARTQSGTLVPVELGLGKVPTSAIALRSLGRRKLVGSLQVQLYWIGTQTEMIDGTAHAAIEAMKNGYSLSAKDD